MNLRRSLMAVGLASAASFGGVIAAAPSAFASAQPQVFGCNYTTSTPLLVEYSPYTSAVKEAQCLLDYWGFNPGAIDGVFGSNTLAAVKGFQSWLHTACGLAVDGKIGTETWHALKNTGC